MGNVTTCLLSFSLLNILQAMRFRRELRSAASVTSSWAVMRLHRAVHPLIGACEPLSSSCSILHLPKALKDLPGIKQRSTTLCCIHPADLGAIAQDKPPIVPHYNLVRD